MNLPTSSLFFFCRLFFAIDKICFLASFQSQNIKSPALVSLSLSLSLAFKQVKRWNFTESIYWLPYVADIAFTRKTAFKTSRFYQNECQLQTAFIYDDEKPIESIRSLDSKKWGLQFVTTTIFTISLYAKYRLHNWPMRLINHFSYAFPILF